MSIALKMPKTALTLRERIWAVLREGQPITLSDLTFRVKAPQDTVRSYLHALRSGGFVASAVATAAQLPRQNTLAYALVKDVGHEAPLVGKGGKVREDAAKNVALWATLRILRRVNARELTAIASSGDFAISPEATNKWLQTLHKAGYLEVVEASRPGKQAVYGLKHSMDTGPKPPQIRREKTVWDANLGLLMLREPENRLDCVEVGDE